MLVISMYLLLVLKLVHDPLDLFVLSESLHKPIVYHFDLHEVELRDGTELFREGERLLAILGCTYSSLPSQIDSYT